MAIANSRNLWNFIQFQAGWFALVLSAAAGLPWLGIAVFAALLVLHLGVFADAREGHFLIVIGVLGWLWESLVHSLGLLSFPDYPAAALAAPWWMLALWLNFGTVIRHSLAWLGEHCWLACVFGALGGPLAFYAGAKLGAVSFVSPLWTSAVLAVGWAVLCPLVFRISARIGTGSRDLVDAPVEVLS